MEILHNVVMTDEDHVFYHDNCDNSDYVTICTRTVRKKWLKQQKRKQMRAEAVEKYHEKAEAVARADILQKSYCEELAVTLCEASMIHLFVLFHTSALTCAFPLQSFFSNH